MQFINELLIVVCLYALFILAGTILLFTADRPYCSSSSTSVAEDDMVLVACYVHARLDARNYIYIASIFQLDGNNFSSSFISSNSGIDIARYYLGIPANRTLHQRKITCYSYYVFDQSLNFTTECGTLNVTCK